MDQDTESIGGIENPEPVPQQMAWVTLILDILALIISVSLFSFSFMIGLLIYIVASRAYSNKLIRLKRFPITGYLTVFVFQGGWIFLITLFAFNPEFDLGIKELLGALVSSLMIGASYPLTQVYQHKQDSDDGVKTLSMLLGIRGTFLFAFIMFLMFNALAASYFIIVDQSIIPFIILVLLSAPAGSFLIKWARMVWENIEAADYKHTMRMSKTGSVCMNVFFLVYLGLKVAKIEFPF